MSRKGGDDLQAFSEGLPILLDEKTSVPLYRSRRELVQRYNIPVSKISEFFLGLSKDKVLATKCNKCGTLYFPPKADCDKCMESSMSYEELSGNAKLVAFTVITVKPSSFSNYKDYIIAIGRLEEGINVLAWLLKEKPDEIKIGMRMKLVVRKREEDASLVYLFVPE